MKLYTEEQIIDIFAKHGNMSEINARNIIDLSEYIEIPSDEEIMKEASKSGILQSYKAFLVGAKWMREKIQGGNK